MRIGLVLNILDEEYQISVYEGVKEKALEMGIEIVCFQQENHDFFSKINFKKFLEKDFFDISGVIILSSVMLDHAEISSKEDLERCWGEIPIVSVGEVLEGVPSVMAQTDASMKELIEHLIVHHKYRKFLYISGSQKHQDAKRREEILEKTVEEYKEEIPHLHYRIRHGWFTEHAAMEVLESFVHENPDYKPDAIICANDNMAIGTYKFLRTHTDNENLKNCAVTGFDDIPQSKYEIPALTTIRQPLEEISTVAVENLYTIINGKPVDREQYIESKVILRNSCGCNKTYDEIAQKKFLAQIQSNYVRSENLLKMVGHIGQDLNYVSTKEGLRYIINSDLDQLEVNNFCVLWFPERREKFNDLLDNGLLVEPVYVRRNGKAFYEFAGNRLLSIGEFYNKFINFDDITPKSMVFRFLTQAKEIKGCILYDAGNRLLPYLSSIGFSISQTLNRVYDLEEKKKRSEYLEQEISKRTKELIEESKKRMEVEAEVLKISEIERQRFSTDLHDDICQRLAGISMLCRSYSNQEKSVSKEQMVELAQLISETLSATRHYAHNSYPVELESLGLGDSLSNLCNSFGTNTGISCSYVWNVKNEIVFTNVQKINIFRIIQEALHNVQKHSKANKVEVSVISIDEGVKINIIDNGCGFSEEKKQTPGLGLKSMQYRANQIDSSFSIKKNEPCGTCIEVIIRDL